MKKVLVVCALLGAMLLLWIYRGWKVRKLQREARDRRRPGDY